MGQQGYSDSLAQRYDAHRFGGESGQFVLQRDQEAIAALLSEVDGRILDIPCGTGVYSADLIPHKQSVISADLSFPMLQIAAQHADVPSPVQCDVQNLPFADETFDGAITLRLFSHCSQPQIIAMLRELERVGRRNSRLVFDSFRWSPRHLPIVRRFLNPQFIDVYSDDHMSQMIGEAGLYVVETDTAWLFSPILHRKLPVQVVRLLTKLERLLPSSWLLRVYWVCTK